MERSQNSVLSWDETQKLSGYSKRIGILQFLNLYKKYKNLRDCEFKWGDEVEYNLVKFSPTESKVRVSLRSEAVLSALNSDRNFEMDKKFLDASWMPEFAAYMIEGTPREPYGGALTNLTEVQDNMTKRREAIQSVLEPNEQVLTISNFPQLGCPGFTYPFCNPHPETSILKSYFYPDSTIFQGTPRYYVGQRNAILRSGGKFNIQVPIWKDVDTPSPFVQDNFPEQNPNMIYMDGLGYGVSCLQVTFQAKDLDEARKLYDNLAVICPIIMSLTASTPFHRGYISDLDGRWNILASGFDDRTADEKLRIPKARHGSIDCYLSTENDIYNDIKILYEEEYYKTLVEAGCDSSLAQHIAHLFIRDPLILLSENKNDEDLNFGTAHFDNILSTNWNTMRLKPPPLNSTDIGWRIEFRSCEIQLTDFENAAIACFLSLLTRIILQYNLDFLIPISNVDENIAKAQTRNSILDQKFYFRKNVRNGENTEVGLFTIHEIINGNKDFPGLVPLITNYLKQQEINSETRIALDRYLWLIGKRADGSLMTPATWLRYFVTHHPKYKQDSVISDEINYDLHRRIEKLQRAPCPLLHGSILIY